MQVPYGFIPFDERHTAENIEAAVRKRLFEDGSPLNIGNLGVATYDNAANVVAGMRLVADRQRHDVMDSLTAAEADMLVFGARCDIHSFQRALEKTVALVPEVKDIYDTRDHIVGVFANARVRIQLLDEACIKEGIDVTSFSSGSFIRWASRTKGIRAVFNMTKALVKFDASHLDITKKEAKDAWNLNIRKWEGFAVRSDTVKNLLVHLDKIEAFVNSSQGGTYPTMSTSFPKLFALRASLYAATAPGNDKDEFATVLDQEMSRRFVLSQATMADADTRIKEAKTALEAAKKKKPDATLPSEIEELIDRSRQVGIQMAATILDPRSALWLNPAWAVVANDKDPAAAALAAEAAESANKHVLGGVPLASNKGLAERGTLVSVGLGYIDIMAKRILRAYVDEAPSASDESPGSGGGNAEVVDIFEVAHVASAASAADSALGTSLPSTAYIEWFRSTFMKGHVKNAALAQKSVKDFYGGIKPDRKDPYYPYLMTTLTIARCVLSAQASSASAERGGSVLTRLVSDDRSSLKPQTVEMLALLRTILRNKYGRKPAYRRVVQPKAPKASAEEGEAGAGAASSSSAAAAAAAAAEKAAAGAATEPMIALVDFFDLEEPDNIVDLACAILGATEVESIVMDEGTVGSSAAAPAGAAAAAAASSARAAMEDEG
jgi:hypothetical protein